MGHPAASLEQEVACIQIMKAMHPDQHIGLLVSVQIDEKMRLAVHVIPSKLPAAAEIVVANIAQLQCLEVQPVKSWIEILNDIGRPSAAVFCVFVLKDVRTCPAAQVIGAKATVKQIAPAVSPQRVVADASEQAIMSRAA